MKVTKKDVHIVQDIFESQPDRLEIKPIQRFIGKELENCGNNVFVDGERTNVLMCSICKDDPAKKKSIFYMTSGSKNELTNASAHYKNNHMNPVEKIKRTANQTTIACHPIAKKSRFSGPSESDIVKYQQKIAIYIAKKNQPFDYMDNAESDILLDAFLG